MAHLLGTQKDKRPDESGLLKVGGVDGTRRVQTRQITEARTSTVVAAHLSFAQGLAVGDLVGAIVGNLAGNCKP